MGALFLWIRKFCKSLEDSLKKSICIYFLPDRRDKHEIRQNNRVEIKVKYTIYKSNQRKKYIIFTSIKYTLKLTGAVKTGYRDITGFDTKLTGCYNNIRLNLRAAGKKLQGVDKVKQT